MSEVRYRGQLQNFTASDADLVAFVRAMLESPLPIPEQLRLVLGLEDIEMLRHAMWAVGRLQINLLVPVLIQLYEAHQDSSLQLMIIQTLGYLEDKDAYQLLLTILQTHPDTQFRIQAAYGFQGRKRSGTVGPLLALSQNTAEDAVLRGMALEALAYQGDKSLLPQILPFLQDAEAVVRWDALYVVGELGDASLASYVEPLLRDTTPIPRMESASIAQDAREVLEKWASTKAEKPDNSV